MKYAIIILGLILITGTAWGMSDYIIPKTWRYKITVEIETPEGVKSGSAVREVQASKNAANIVNRDAPAIEYKIIGEAVAIDLQELGILFALIDWSSRMEIETAFPTKYTSPSEYINFYNQLSLGTSAELNTNHPKMVTFTDINDLGTSKLVYENTLYDNGHVQYVNNFEEVFGEGVHLKKITVQITDEPITWKMEKYLGKRRAVGPYEFVKGEAK